MAFGTSISDSLAFKSDPVTVVVVVELESREASAVVGAHEAAPPVQKRVGVGVEVGVGVGVLLCFGSKVLSHLREGGDQGASDIPQTRHVPSARNEAVSS